MFTLPLTKVGTSGLYAGVANLTHGAAFTWHYEAGGARFGGGQLEVYETHPDARERAGVPKGTRQADAVVEQQDFRGDDARLVGVCAGAVQRGEPCGGHGVPGWRGGAAVRRAGIRQPDREGRHPGHGRHLHRARRHQGAARQPQLRVRHALRSVRALPARRDPSRGGENGQASPRRRGTRHCRPEQRRDCRVHRRVGAARASSARCCPGSAASRTSSRARRSAKAGTTTRR